MSFLRIILPVLVLVALSVAGLAISILVKKSGKFPNTHVSGNRYLRQRGIYCAQTQDKLEQKKGIKKTDFLTLKLAKKE